MLNWSNDAIKNLEWIAETYQTVAHDRVEALAAQRRGLRGVSQEELAGRVEIHRTYMGGIERGERNPTLTMITRIAAALNVSAAQLLREAEKH